MKRPRNTVTPFSRDYRRPPRWDMGLPPRKPRQGWRARLADPRFYLWAVIGLAAVPLLLLPLGDALAGQVRAAPQADCRLLRVIDGDTVQIRCPGRGITSARITGYDTPELFSPQCNAELRVALRATWLLRRMIWSATEIAIAREGTDRYGRALIALSVDGEPAGRRIIAAGLARPYDGGRRAGWCG